MKYDAWRSEKAREKKRVEMNRPIYSRLSAQWMYTSCIQNMCQKSIFCNSIWCFRVAVAFRLIFCVCNVLFWFRCEWNSRNNVVIWRVISSFGWILECSFPSMMDFDELSNSFCSTIQIHTTRFLDFGLINYNLFIFEFQVGNNIVLCIEKSIKNN